MKPSLTDAKKPNSWESIVKVYVGVTYYLGFSIINSIFTCGLNDLHIDFAILHKEASMRIQPTHFSCLNIFQIPFIFLITEKDDFIMIHNYHI